MILCLRHKTDTNQVYLFCVKNHPNLLNIPWKLRNFAVLYRVYKIIHFLTD